MRSCILFGPQVAKSQALREQAKKEAEERLRQLEEEEKRKKAEAAEEQKQREAELLAKVEDQQPPRPNEHEPHVHAMPTAPTHPPSRSSPCLAKERAAAEAQAKVAAAEAAREEAEKAAREREALEAQPLGRKRRPPSLRTAPPPAASLDRLQARAGAKAEEPPLSTTRRSSARRCKRSSRPRSARRPTSSPR